MQKTIVRTLSTLFPGAMVNLAYRKLTSPQIRKLRDNELIVLDQAEKTIFPFKGFEIQTYKWAGGGNSVLLVHGWEGQAGNFSDLVVKLREANYTIYAFDGPSHGFSSRGETSLFEFRELTGLLIHKLGVRKLVSHSFGGVATIWAMIDNPELEIDKYALLTTPDRFRDRIQDVADQAGITDKVRDRLIARLETEIDIPIEDTNVSDFAAQTNIASARIWHDENDRVIPIAQSQNVCDKWPVCDMRVVSGTGHFRILRDEDVLKQVVEFLDA